MHNKRLILSFNSIADISSFKKECMCSDFYIDRDHLTLVGTFSEEQVQTAINKYQASYTIDNDELTYKQGQA